MKALAKVYPVLASGRVLAVLSGFIVLAVYFLQKPPSSIGFTVGNFSQVLLLKESIEMLPFEFRGEKWHVAAMKTGSLGDVLADLMQKNRVENAPFVSFIRDGQGKDYIAFVSAEGGLKVNSVDSLPTSLQGVEAKVPEEIGQDAFYFQIFP